MQPDTIKIRASLWYTKADKRLQIQYFNKKHCGPQQRGCNLTPWAKTSCKTRQSGPQKRGSTNITNTIMRPFPRRILQVISWRSPQQWGKLDPLNVGTSQVNNQSETGQVEHNNVDHNVKLKQWLAKERVSCYSHSETETVVGTRTCLLLQSQPTIVWGRPQICEAKWIYKPQTRIAFTHERKWQKASASTGSQPVQAGRTKDGLTKSSGNHILNRYHGVATWRHVGFQKCSWWTPNHRSARCICHLRHLNVQLLNCKDSYTLSYAGKNDPFQIKTKSQECTLHLPSKASECVTTHL